MKKTSYDKFNKVELRVGKIITAKSFPEAKNPAYKLTIDFGKDIGIMKSSAQITDLYSIEKLIGKMVIAVVNLPPKQIGPFMSECLVTGFKDKNGKIILSTPDSNVPLGCKLI